MYPNETIIERKYVNAKQFLHQLSKKGAKFTHDKIHKIAIFIRHFMRMP